MSIWGNPVALGGGGAEDVFAFEGAYGTSGTTSLSKTVTIQESGTYQILAGGSVANCSLKLNGTALGREFAYSGWYAVFYSKTLTLSAGDVLAFAASDTGKCYMFFAVIKV